MALRILHVLDHSMPIMSGYTVRSNDIVTAQKRIGLEPTLITGPLHEVDDAESSDIVINDVPYVRTRVPKSMMPILKHRVPLLREYTTIHLFQKRLEYEIRTKKFDVLHAHSPALSGVAALNAGRKLNIPVVYEIRAFWEDAAVDQNKTNEGKIRYRLSRAMEQYVCERSAAVIGISDHIVSEMKQRGIPAERVFHVPNGVDTKRFTPLPRDLATAAELNLKDDETVFAFMGSLYRYEGLEWMVRAAAQLHRTVPHFRILILGYGEESERIRRAIEETDSGSYIHYLGPKPHSEVSRYYSVVDVMVFPRRRIRLTELVTPLKPLEAMAQEKAVLGSNVGGIRELVEGEKTALLFEPDSVEDFCRQATRLITDPQLRRTIARAGRKNACEEKDWLILAERYRAIYDFALQRKALAHAAD